MRMLSADVVVRPVDAPLQLQEEVLCRVGRSTVWPHVLAGLVITDLARFARDKAEDRRLATMRPERSPAIGSRSIAFRSRWSMCQADFGATPYLRSISRAEMPFLLEHVSKITKTHVRTGILEP